MKTHQDQLKEWAVFVRSTWASWNHKSGIYTVKASSKADACAKIKEQLREAGTQTPLTFLAWENEP